jgi:hypothetical protein
MKKLILFFAAIILLSSCANDKIINGKVAKTYGWANTSDRRDSVMYRVSVENVFWSILLCETVVVPIWLTGWELYEPLKPEENVAR